MEDNGWLNEEQAAQMLGVIQGRLAKWRFMGKGPVWHKLGGSVRYKQADLQAYINASRVEPKEGGGK